MLIDHTLVRCHIKNNFQRREVVLAFSDSTTISFISMSKTIYLIKILWTIVCFMLFWTSLVNVRNRPHRVKKNASWFYLDILERNNLVRCHIKNNFKEMLIDYTINDAQRNSKKSMNAFTGVGARYTLLRIVIQSGKIMFIGRTDILHPLQDILSCFIV